MKRHKYTVYLKQDEGTHPKIFFGNRANLEQGFLFIFDTDTFTVLNLENILWYAGEIADEEQVDA